MLGNSNHDYFYFLLHWLLYYIQFTALEVNTFILFLYAYRYFHVYSLYSWILNFNSQPLLATQRMTAFDFAHTICTICVTFHAAFVIDGSFHVHFWFAVQSWENHSIKYLKYPRIAWMHLVSSAIFSQLKSCRHIFWLYNSNYHDSRFLGILDCSQSTDKLRRQFYFSQTWNPIVK